MIYKNLLIIYILLFIKICIIYSQNATTIHAIIYSFNDDENSYHRQLINAFNEYSLKNNLNITAQLEALTPQVSTTEIQDYGNTIDSLLKKNQINMTYTFIIPLIQKYMVIILKTLRST